jgi:hypothetical protein
MVFWVMLGAFILHFLPKRSENFAERTMGRFPVWGSIAVMVLFIYILVQVKSADTMLPIYLQF